MKTLYGLADDWPISYQELEAYYGRAEIALGVAGVADNPFDSDRSTGYPLPPFPLSYSDRVVQSACHRLGIGLHHVPWARNSVPHQNRPACLAFSTCQRKRVCPIFAQYTAERHIQLAEKTGNVRIIPNASALRINIGDSGRVKSVTYAERDRASREQRARLVILTAHAIESARLLLLSRSSYFPDGLANSSGLVGKNFMEHLWLAGRGRVRQRVFPHRIGFHTAESHHFCRPEKRGDVGGFKLEFLNSVGPMPVDIASESGHWGAQLAE
jgi:choline dehydrogenase-like flavoprotein